jgi:hypothetical protein
MTEKNHVLRPSGISLGRWLAAAALCLFSLGAWASFPATSTSQWSVSGNYPNTNQAASCAAWVNQQAGGNSAFTSSLSGNLCRLYNPYNSSYTSWSMQSTPVYSCPANASLSGSTCTCTSGVESNGSCVIANGTYWSGLLNASGQSLSGEGGCGISSCFQGFTVTGSGGTCWKDKTTGKNMYEIYGPYTSKNQPCSVTPAAGGSSAVEPPATPGPADCAGYWGSVNGVDRCIPKGNTPGTGTAVSDSKATSTTDSTGTTTTTRDGVTVCQDGTCTTTRTTTTTAPGGTPQTVTSSSSQPKVSFCQENPSAKACQAADPCQDNPDSLACMKSGTPTDQTLPTEQSGINAVTAVSFTAAAGCPADLSFGVNGSTYAFSYAAMCNTASGYGSPVVLVLGAALAAFVFIGGFKA